MKIRLLLTILLLTATIAANTQIMERTFLKKVLTKLEKIESATYYVTDESRQVSSIRNYANRKKLNDTILNAANEVIKQYQTSGATPYFFIVDQEGIRSYSKENTDKEIIHTIKELL